MKKISSLMMTFALALSLMAFSSNLEAYTKKAPYQGYGKPSKVNGLPKFKTTSGHFKKTSKGYTYVNPYARSK